MAQKQPRDAQRAKEEQEESQEKRFTTAVELLTEDLVGKGKRTPAPPEAPQIRRRVSFYRTQAIGMPLILLLPVLGLCGVFDNHTKEVVAGNSGSQMVVRYPDRWRDTSNGPMTVTLTNIGESTESYEVSFERQFFDVMEDVQFKPEPDKVDGKSYIFEIDSVRPGESEVVTVDFKAYDSGIYRGRVSASSRGSVVATAELQTLVLP